METPSLRFAESFFNETFSSKSSEEETPDRKIGGRFALREAQTCLPVCLYVCLAPGLSAKAPRLAVVDRAKLPVRIRAINAPTPQLGVSTVALWSFMAHFRLGHPRTLPE